MPSDTSCKNQLFHRSPVCWPALQILDLPAPNNGMKQFLKNQSFFLCTHTHTLCRFWFSGKPQLIHLENVRVVHTSWALHNFSNLGTRLDPISCSTLTFVQYFLSRLPLRTPLCKGNISLRNVGDNHVNTVNYLKLVFFPVSNKRQIMAVFSSEI